MSNVRVRYAPSPTGSPHIGNIRTAIFDWLFARHSGGTFIFRIEDTDKTRETATGIDEQIEALRWLGLDWDEGIEVGGPHGPYIQSQRLAIYQEYAERLLAAGHAYRAYDTKDELDTMRAEQQRRGLPPGYDRRHRYLNDDERAEYERAGRTSVIRMAVPREGETKLADPVYGNVVFENKVLDDHILLKSDGFPTYHLASVVDDHLMKISHVFRGEEWLPSAPIHVLLYQFLGWTPPVIAHLPLMLGPDRKKLGKRNKEFSLFALDYKKNGYLPEAMLNFLTLQGWSPKEDRDLYSREELIEKFSLDGLLNRGPIVDKAKLEWFNAEYIRALPIPQLVTRALPYLQSAGLVEAEPSPATLEYLERIFPLVQERMPTLAAAAEAADFFLLGDHDYAYDDKAVEKWLTNPAVAERLAAVKGGMAGLTSWEHDTVEAVVRDVITRFEVKGGEVIHPVRVAISGRMTGPSLFDSIVVLGKDRVVRRLKRTIAKIGEVAAASGS